MIHDLLDKRFQNTRSRAFETVAFNVLAQRSFDVINHKTLTVDNSHLQCSQIVAWLKGHLYPAWRTLIYVSNQWALRDIYLTIIEQDYVIPERVGLLGFNNTDWKDLTQYPISTTIEPIYEEGHLACEMLLHQLKDPETPPVQKVLPCTVGWLSSTL
ncbi:hypothetical protein HMPREF2898_03915 [Atopobium sp. HMSC064B08]|nr:hypothetical protein HMPREF2898_03915 [Atopobium sp. HMSC064B08]